MFKGGPRSEHRPGTILTSDPKERERDGTEQADDTLTHSNRGEVVVPIRYGIERVVLENRLAQLKEDLQYFGGLLNHYRDYEIANYDDIQGPNFKNLKILRKRVAEIKIEIEDLMRKIKLLSGLQIA